MRLRRTALLGLPAAAVLLVACGEQERPAQPPAATAASGLTTARDDRAGLTVTFPSTWRRARRTLTPHLLDPTEVLALGTAALVPNSARSACAQHPVAALERLRPRDVLVSVQERLGAAPKGFPPGAPQLAATPPDRSEAPACLRRPVAFRTWWMPFRASGRSFYALVAIGDRAPARRRAEVQRVLDTLRFDVRPVQDDRQRRVRFALPRGWQRFGERLTQAVELPRQLAFGTFDLDQDEPDPNCAPATAIDQRPRDGGMVFVFEYADLNARQIARLPRRPRRFRLHRRDPQAYECFGVSSVVRWREHGRAFQAHVYGEGRRVLEALALLDSFDVRALRR